MTTYINLFAGPGAGKSTTAASVFVTMKQMGQKAELITEYAKELEWEGNHRKMANQAYLFGKQLQRQIRLYNQVDYAVTDSPILLGLVYAKDYPTTFAPFALDMFHSFKNKNFFIKRVKPYMKYGRSQTESEAIDKDNEIRAMLDKYNIPVIEIEGDQLAAQKIVNYCI